MQGISLSGAASAGKIGLQQEGQRIIRQIKVTAVLIIAPPPYRLGGSVAAFR